MTSIFSRTRRSLVQGLSLGAAAAALGGRTFARMPGGDGIEERLGEFFGESDQRPEFAWTNCEDVLYHDISLPPEVAAAPEFSAFANSPTWVFNRSTQWLRASGTIVCFDSGGDLLLTGVRQASRWHSGPDNLLSDEGDFTLFTKKSRRRRDAVILPAFQFRQNQHPVLEVEVAEANTAWQLCITPKGRGGRPVIVTDWQSGPAKLAIDLARELAARGFNWSYPELHIAVGTWNADPLQESRLRFRMQMPGQAAIAACLPVIRTSARSREGVPITAVVLDEHGMQVGSNQVRVAAQVAERHIELEEKDGIWRAALQNIALGAHQVMLRSEGRVQAQTWCDIRVTDGEFLSWAPKDRWASRGGKPLGPLSGSYQGTFYFRQAGRPGESMVQGQRAWDGWDRTADDSEHMHFWESLTEIELDERFRFLQQSGFDLTSLHSHWGAWERLDAGGRIAPHSAEQLARYLRIAARYGLAHLQALASGPYATKEIEYGGTVPYSRYLDAGFKTEQFMVPGSSFDDLYHQYLRDFAVLFSDETALFGYTAHGEGDFFVGPPRSNDTMRIIREIDKNHAFLAEAVWKMAKLPQEHARGFEQDHFGGRTYWIGVHHPPAADLAVYFKFLSMAGMFLSEGSWPPMPSYIRFHYDVMQDGNGSSKCWTGTEHYRRRVRDTLYLGLVNLMPIVNTWDEMFTEDEHLLLRDIRGLIDWRQPFAPPKLAIAVDSVSADLDSSAYGLLIKYEQALSRLGVGYRLVNAAERARAGAALVLDGKVNPAELKFGKDGGILPEEILRAIPLEVSSGFSTNHAVTADGGTMMAYVYNTTRIDHRYYWLGGSFHRAPTPAALEMTLRRPTDRALRARLYDLGEHRLISDSVFKGSHKFSLGTTASDYFVLVTPA